MATHSELFFRYVGDIADAFDHGPLIQLVDELVKLRDNGGRLFLLGVGGSAANCSHAANDFRKLCGIEAYAPTDNVAELTARTNDDGWESVFAEHLKGSRLTTKDALLIMSVGGGDEARGISVNLIQAIRTARSVGARVYGIVGRSEGYTAQHADVAIIVPEVNSKLITPLTESFQAIVWHCLVSHPRLQRVETKW